MPLILCCTAEDGKKNFSVQTLTLSADPKGSFSGNRQFWYLSSLGRECLPCPGSLLRDADWDLTDKSAGI